VSNFIDIINNEFKNEPPKVILDVGSRDLEHSLLFGNRYPSARIIAFEPNPFGIKNCKFKLSNLKNPNIELMEIAVSDQEGEMDFYSVTVNDGCSSLLEPIDVPFGLKQWNKISVQVKRLDSILKELGIEQVDVLWLDTQGTELKVLKGLGDYLNNVRCIHTEACPKAYYKGHILKNELEEFLHEQGFETTFVPAKGHPYGEGDLNCVRK